MARNQHAVPILGVVFPDDPIPSEMHSLDRWLAGRGFAEATAKTLLSKGTGGHFREDLLATGDLAVISPVGRTLAEHGCGAVIWACTSASFIGGLDWAQAQAEGLAQACGVPASSTTLAFIDALQAIKVARVHVLGAYPQPVTEAFIDCLGAAGISVDAWRALDAPDGSSSFRLSLVDEVARFAESLSAGDDAPLLIPDTAIDSLDLLALLEERCGRQVLSANQVTLWQGLRLLGVDPSLRDAGRLLAGAASVEKDSHSR